MKLPSDVSQGGGKAVNGSAPPSARMHGGGVPDTVAVLGWEHPLVRAIDSSRVVAHHARIVAVVLAASAFAAAGGLPAAVEITLAAGVVLPGLAIVAGALRQAQRQHAIELILQGREQVPLEAVQREVRRLLARPTRLLLAARIEGVLDDPVPGSGHLRAGSRYAPLTPCTPLVHAVAKQLRAEPAGAQGIALAERLLSNGGSTLYGTDATGLRADLSRVLYLLGGSRPAG